MSAAQQLIYDVVERGMPKKLADRGWELLTNGSTPERFRSRNATADVELGPFPSIDDAVMAAWDEQARLDGSEEAVEAAADRIIEEAKQSEGMARTEALPVAEAPEPAEEELPPMPELEEGSEILLHPERVRTDGGTQPRALFADEVVEKYKEAMLAGAVFPAIDVFWDGENAWLADGFYRTEATKRAELEEINAKIHLGTQRDAILFSLSANETHGQPRTNEDKRRAVTTMLIDDEWRQLSDSEIARRCNVSQPFVGKVREELTTQNVISESTTRRGADGVVRDTKNIGRKSEEAQEAEREANPELFTEPQQAPAAEEEADDSAEPASEQTFWLPSEIADALGRHGGVLYRLQLEEMGCKHDSMLSAVESGAIAQPETGKFTLPDHQPQPSTGTSASKSPASSPAAKSKPTLEEIAHGRMLVVSFTVIPGLKGKISVVVNSSMDKAKALKRTIDSVDVRGFSQPVMNMIFEHLRTAPTAKSSASRRPSVKKTARKSPAKKTAKRSSPKKKAPKPRRKK